MTPYFEDAGVRLYHGDVLETLKQMPDESVNCCITSPPYWGLRSYGIPETIWGGEPGHSHVWGEPIIVNATNHTDKRRWNHTRNGRGEVQPEEKQVAWLRTNVEQGTYCECGAWRGNLGLEPTPWLFVEHIVMVFEEVRRILKPDGTAWVNFGDSYATGAGKACSPGGGKQGEDFAGPRGYRGTHEDSPKHAKHSQVPDQKNPNAGIPVYQPNRMPIPGLKPKDLVGIPWRVAFALQDAGWWLRSDIVWAKPAPMPESVTDRPTRSHEYIFLLAKSQSYYFDHEAIKEPSVSDRGSGNGYKRNARLSYSDDDGARGSDEPWKPKGKAGKNAFRGQGHFRNSETGPANREGRDMRDIGAGDTRNRRDVWTVNTEPFPEAHFATFPPALILPCVLAGCPAGGTILDPFSGAGTTAMVAKENGRNAIGIDLNEEYLKMSVRRLSQAVLAF